MKIFNRERLGMWKLKPCPCCGGDARIEYIKDKGTYRAVCLECGLQTNQFFSPENARAAWDKRCTEYAMVLTLDKLFESVYHYEDSAGCAAAWLETKGKTKINAVIVGVGMDYVGFWTIDLRGMNDPEARSMPPQIVDEYGITWRLWDKKPTDNDRRNTPWET